MEWKSDAENWETIQGFLPRGWRERARELGALQRQRKVGPEELLRVLLIHLADGCSLKEAVARAKVGGISALSSVALYKRLKASSEWLRWMAMELLLRRRVEVEPPGWVRDYRVRSVDASVVSEPGSTGTDWRLHYSLELFGLSCDQFLVTRPEVGESFHNFTVRAGDLLMGDRAYGTLKGFWYVKRRGGEFLVRLKSKAFPLSRPGSEREFPLLAALDRLKAGEVGQWEMEGRAQKHPPLRFRLCAVKKSEEVAQAAMDCARREMKKQQQTLDPNPLELHRYVILATSLLAGPSPTQVAQLYRLRWQIEVAFKRLKSIMGLGHLPKTDWESARAWLHGKMFVALLAQALVDEGRFFSPWGYPLEGN
jgi:hypothetical protein